MDEDTTLQVPLFSPRTQYEIHSDGDTTPSEEFGGEDSENDEPDSPPPFDSINTEEEPEEQATQNIDADEDDDLPPSGAIGNTLYSELFVVNLLGKLMEFESELKNDKPFERQLGQFWDMTADKDVVLFLIQHDAMELFLYHIENTADRRLTEILVGIIANMCIVKETCVELSKSMDRLKRILSLLTCSDVPTLIQTIRVLSAVGKSFPRGGNNDKLFRFFKDDPTIMENICMLLTNSRVKKVLVHMMITLKVLAHRFVLTILSYVTVLEEFGVYEREPFTFLNLFVTEKIIKSLNKAFNNLFPEHESINQGNRTTEIQNAFLSPGENNTISTLQAMLAFLSVHRVNLEYNPEISYSYYEPDIKDVFKCINRILQPLCEQLYLLPLESYHGEILSDINIIFASSYYPFDEACFYKVLTIWRIAFQHLVTYNEFEAYMEEDVDTNVFFSSIYMFIQCVSSRAESEELLRVLLYFPSTDIAFLIREIDKFNLDDLHRFDINYFHSRDESIDDERLKMVYRYLTSEE